MLFGTRQSRNIHKARMTSVQKISSETQQWNVEELESKIMNDKTMFFDNDVFLISLQDHGVSVDNKAKREHFRPQGSKVQFSQMFNVGKQLLTLYESRPDYFKMSSKNRSQTLQKINSLLCT